MSYSDLFFQILILVFAIAISIVANRRRLRENAPKRRLDFRLRDSQAENAGSIPVARTKAKQHSHLSLLMFLISRQ